MENKKYDFCGWATRYGVKCSDGRVISRGAFKDCDGETIPLVWNHGHGSPLNVIGHAMLEDRAEGMYIYGYLNDSEYGKTSKIAIRHGDVTSLSIYANKLEQTGPYVEHGVIREVSLVLAGANPGAYIEDVVEHGESDGSKVIIYSGEEGLSLTHADEPEDEKKEGSSDKKDSDETDDNKTIGDVINTMNEEQQNVLYGLLGRAMGMKSTSDTKDEDEDKDDSEGDKSMKHNVFDSSDNEQVLCHDAVNAILSDGKRLGSLKDSFLAHADEYGIENINYLFPDARNIDNTPAFIKRKTDWVSVVMNGVHRSPFSRIKTIFADITADEARAKGYTKGKKKIEEVFTLLKRTTDPTTIYKKQKMDRDDVIDITDFNVVAWIKTEMRMMLDEEIARAILVGDGRSTASDDKIDESKIRPVWTDDDLYTIKARFSVASTATEAEIAKTFIRMAIKSRKNYQGSGNPIMFMSEDLLNEILLLEDEIGHFLYESEEKLRQRLRVSQIVPISIFDTLSHEVSSKTYKLDGLMLNLDDYNVGADKGGEINMFDDFDIDYNQQKYLIETRASGALRLPYSAIAIEHEVTSSSTPSDDGDDDSGLTQ